MLRSKSRVDSVRVCCRAIGETRYRAEYGSKPGRRRPARVLHQAGIRGVLECTLRLAVIVETKLINCAVIDGPRVTDIPLLEARSGCGSKTGHVGPRSLELSKRRR